MPRGSQLAKGTAKKATAKAPAKRRTPNVPPGVGAGVDPFDRQIHLPERGPATATAGQPARVSVSVDTLITRVDLGPNCKTFVAAGTLIPFGLEGLPRAPA
jgi:hypothetical protein